MRWVYILFLFAGLSPACAQDHTSSNQIVYLASLDSVKVSYGPIVVENPHGELPIITVSTGCARIELEFTVLRSSIGLPETLSFSPQKGIWCLSHFEADAFYGDFLVFADGTPDNLQIVLHASFEQGIAYTMTDPNDWNPWAKDFLGDQMLSKIKLENIEGEHAFSVYDNTYLAEEFIAYNHDLTEAERRQADTIFSVEGTEVTFLKAIDLSNIFPEMPEE
ncbi:MAG: hypothetical protein AAGK66_01345 [Pseudomonadota bacterium]